MTGASADTRKARLRSALKLVLGILMIVGTLRLLGANLALDTLAQADAGWLGAALLAWTLAQLAAVGRWHFTAQRMAAPMTASFAVTQTYVASLLNQTLLSSIGGDAMRISTHGASLARGASGYALALRTHLLDRASGQAVLLLVTCIAAPHWLASQSATVMATLAALAAFALGAGLWVRRHASHTARLSAWLEEAKVALWSRNAWLVQLALTSLVIGGCLATYFCAARALAVPLSVGDLLRIGPLVLTAMALPIGVAGFGPREAASAALFAANSLDPGRGTWVAVVYGLVSLVGALPAIPLWLLSRNPTLATPNE